jgi:hypothetical protein
MRIFVAAPGENEASGAPAASASNAPGGVATIAEHIASTSIAGIPSKSAGRSCVARQSVIVAVVRLRRSSGISAVSFIQRARVSSTSRSIGASSSGSGDCAQARMNCSSSRSGYPA